MTRHQGNSIKKFNAGEFVFREGDTDKELFIIISGTAQVIKKTEGTEIILTELNVGDFFGEMAMFSGAPRSASIRAKDDLETIVINEPEFRKQIDDLPDWFRNMFEEVVMRLRKMDERIIAQFKSGVEFSILHLFQLIADQYGTHSGQKLTVDKKFTVDKVHNILGIAIGEILKHLEDFLKAGLIELEEGTQKLIIPDKKDMLLFIDFYQSLLELEDIDKVKPEFPQLDIEKLNKFEKQFHTIRKKYTRRHAVLKS